MLYDYYLRQHYNYESITNIVNFLKKDLDISLADNPANVVKTGTTHHIPWAKAKNYLSDLENFIHFVNKTSFGFDLYNLTDYDTVNLNEYFGENEGRYDWHWDFPIHNASHIKLTAIVNLSTELYEGGEFEIFIERPSRIIEIDSPGAILIFPSFIPHRVKPVTKGIRRTLSIWADGPKFI